MLSLRPSTTSPPRYTPQCFSDDEAAPVGYGDVPAEIKKFAKATLNLEQEAYEWLLTLVVCVYTLFVAYTSGLKLRGTEAMMTRSLLTVGACILYSLFK